MFFRAQKIKEWADSNNLRYTKNNKKGLFHYWADKNIVEGNYKGKNIKVLDEFVNHTGSGEGGLTFGTVIKINEVMIVPNEDIKSFKFFGKLLSVKQISEILDKHV